MDDTSPFCNGVRKNKTSLKGAVHPKVKYEPFSPRHYGDGGSGDPQNRSRVSHSDTEFSELIAAGDT